MAGSLWLLVVFKNPLLWALHSKQLPLEFYVHILKQNGFATSRVYKSQSSPINVYFYSSMQKKHAAQVYTCVVCIILKLGSLSKHVFSNPHQPEVDFLHSWAVVMAKFLSSK